MPVSTQLAALVILLVGFAMSVRICSTDSRHSHFFGLTLLLYGTALSVYALMHYALMWLVFCIGFLEVAFDATCVLAVGENIAVSSSSSTNQKSRPQCTVRGAQN